MTPPYGRPSVYESRVVRRNHPRSPYPKRQAAASRTPLQDLHGVITPNGLHYERHHFGVPSLAPDAHRLIIRGDVGAATAGEDYSLGKPATPAEIFQWDIDAAPDGRGLPPAEGSVKAGEVIFAFRCAACHGDHGQGHPMNRLAGGIGSIGASKPVKTVGSIWPYAATLFDFVRRAMPFNAPQSLSPAEVYAVCAYVLYLNGLVPGDAALDAKSLPRVKCITGTRSSAPTIPRAVEPAPVGRVGEPCDFT